MTKSEHSTSTQDETIRRAILIGRSVTANTLLFLALGVYLAVTTGAWQAYTFIFVAVQAIVGDSVGTALIQRGRTTFGGLLTLIVNLIGAVFAALLFVSIGYVAVAYILITTFFIVRYAVPKETQRLALVITAIGLAITIVVEITNPAWRLVSQFMLTISPILTGTLGVAFVVVIAYQAWRGSLRNKLMAIFMVVVVLTVSAVGVAAVLGLRPAFTQQIGEAYDQQAVNLSQLAYSFLEVKMSQVATMATSDLLKEQLEKRNASYTGSEAAILAEIQALDKHWVAAGDDDPLIQSIITPDPAANPTAFQLRDYLKAFPDHTEIFVTDRYGATVGATERLSDYYQADEDWWKAAWNDGQGAYYISEPEYDESAGVLASQIALPVYSEETGEVLGIIRSTLVMDGLYGIIDSVRYGETGHAVLFKRNAEVLYEPTGYESSAGLDYYLRERLVTETHFMTATDADGHQTIFGHTPLVSPKVAAGTTESRIGKAIESLGLAVVVRQETNEAFAPITRLTQTIILVAMVVMMLVGAGTFYLASFISRPILALTKTVEAVGAGDLNAPLPPVGGDEIGTLTTGFGNMVARLREMVRTLEQRVAERTQNLELAADVGRSVSRVRDLNVMLQDACELIRNEFDLYYVQVYLTDPSQMTLQLQAGTGEVGAQLLERRHRLQLNTGSINGRAAVEKRTMVISDTSESATFRPNSLLPETRGEMAVPLIVNDKVVGVLDMQSSEPGTLNEEVIPAFEALAGQLAVAIQNATLLEEAKQARAEVEVQARRQIRANWAEHLDAIHKPEQLGFVFDRSEIAPLKEADELLDESGAVSAPISLTGEEFGSLVVELDDESKNKQTSELVNIVARQVAQQIENLRLVESAERYRYEAEQVARRQTHEGWQGYVNTKTNNTLSFLYDLNEVRPYNNGHTTNASGLTLPLKVREETIGKLSVDGLVPDDKDSLELANAVAERLGAHIESLRLSGQIEQRAQREQTLRQITSALRGSTNPETIMRIAVRELGSILGRKTIVQVTPPEGGAQAESAGNNENGSDSTAGLLESA